MFRRRPDELVTRGHNIVADGWAGASNPHPQPNPGPKVSKTLVFNSITMTDRPTNRRTDKASYRVACPQLTSAHAHIRLTVQLDQPTSTP